MALPTLAGGATLHTHYDAQQEGGANGSTVTAITDRSGNSRTATKSGAGTLTLDTAGINGHTAYNFPGTVLADTAAFTSIPNTSIIHFFVVLKHDSVPGASTFLGSASGTNLRIGQGTAAWNAHRGGTNIIGGTVDTSAHRVRLFTPASGAATATLSIDGSVIAGPASISSAAQTTWRLGNYSNGTQAFTGKIGEVIVYVGTLTSQDILDVEAYLTARWAAASSSAGVAAGTFTFAGTASGRRSPKAAATGTFTFTGGATGKRNPTGAAAGGTATYAGAAVGRRAPVTTASGTWGTVGTATGKRSPAATATGTFAWAGTAVGATTTRGTATGTLAWTGTAVGTNTEARDLALTVVAIGPRFSTEAIPPRLTATALPRRLSATREGS